MNFTTIVAIGVGVLMVMGPLAGFDDYGSLGGINPYDNSDRSNPTCWYPGDGDSPGNPEVCERLDAGGSGTESDPHHLFPREKVEGYKPKCDKVTP
ncbi:MAG: hypothetical protein GF315_10285 [candidate division Zixibacteria bacterium]|nr:hypothetical protein [candidate division Zixibacteria bacterium]